MRDNSIALHSKFLRGRCLTHVVREGNRKVGDEYVVLDPGMGEERRYKLDKDGGFAATESYYPHLSGKEWTRDRPVAHGYIMSSVPPPPPKAKAK